MRRTLAPFTEILVVRTGSRRHNAGIPRVERARAIEVTEDELRFCFKLTGSDVINGYRAFENEGITWALGWDFDESALLAAWALADHPRPVSDSPLPSFGARADVQVGNHLIDFKTSLNRHRV